MSLHAADARRVSLSMELINPHDMPRYVVGLEGARVDELLDDRYTNPDANGSRFGGIGRALLQGASLCDQKAEFIKQPDFVVTQSKPEGQIQHMLDTSRMVIRGGILWGVDDVAVDNYLGIRAEASILPGFLCGLHKQAEQKLGHELSFLAWMSHKPTSREPYGASDDQLLNVWQWHDQYLAGRNNDPAFRERIIALREGYMRGLTAAIQAKDLHPSLGSEPADINRIMVVHGSPFSPILAFAKGYADKHGQEVQVRQDVTDYEMYHEVTHMLNGGLVGELDEGATDMIATTIYNHAHPVEERVAIEDSVYFDQVAVLQSIGRMTDGEVGLFNPSSI